jgi:Bacterial conjugation TrbI-like protein
MVSETAPLPPEKPIEKTIEKEVDSAKSAQKFKNWIGDKLSPITTSDNYLTDEREADPGKVGAIVGVGFIGLLVAGIGAGIFFRVTFRPPVATPLPISKALSSTPATTTVASNPSQAQNLPRPLPMPDPNPRLTVGSKQTYTGPAPATIPPLPRSSQQYVQPGQRFDVGVNAAQARDQQLAQRKAAAWSEVANRGKVRDPLTGSVLRAATLPPANQLPQLQGGGGSLPRITQLSPPPAPIGYRPQQVRQYFNPNSNAAANPGYQSQQSGASSPYADQANPYGSVGDSPTQSGQYTQPSQPVQSGQSQNSGYSPIGYQQPGSNPMFNTGVKSTILPAGQMIQAALISEVRFLQSSGSQKSQTPVIAQVQGNVRVDGQVVIPSGALLLGTVIASDPGLGRVRIEIQSVQFGTTTIPVHGAYAWTMYGDNPQTATLAEGIPAEATGMPNHVASDLQAAAGGAFSTFSRTLGQQVTTGVSSAFGTPYSSTFNQGDLSTSAQRAISQGASEFMNRQVRRSDQATAQQTARGPIYRVAPRTQFVVYFTEGI